MTSEEVTSQSEKGRPVKGQPPPTRFYDGAVPLTPILNDLEVPSCRPVLVVIGWAGTTLAEDTNDVLDLLLREVVAPVCSDEGAVIVSGGTDSGVMAALGRAVADRPAACLVGVAPDSKLIGLGATAEDSDAARPEQGHRLIRTPGTVWGAEGPFLVRIAEQIARGRQVVVLALGGGEGTHRELELAARRRWPVILTTGHGGASEEVAKTLGLLSADVAAGDAGGRRSRGSGSAHGAEAPSGEPSRRKQEMQAAFDSDCYVAAPLGERAIVERLLRWRLCGDEVLKNAWTQFAHADELAAVHKKPTTKMALGVAVLATLTVIAALALGWVSGRPGYLPAAFVETGSIVFKALATGLPLIAAGLLGLIDRRARTGSWIDLRAVAESLISDIYRARARAGTYSADPASWGARLQEAVAALDMRTKGRSLLPSAPVAANYAWPPDILWARVPKSDSLLGPLAAGVYDSARVINQLEHYQERARRLDREAARAAAVIFSIAGIAAFLLALSWRWSWLTAVAAVFASIAAALVSWREYRQRDARADAMLATCVALRAARGRWLCNRHEDREAPEALAALVHDVESALTAEGSDWERSLRQAQQSLVNRYRGS